MSATGGTRLLRRVVDKLSKSQLDIEAAELRQDARSAGCQPIRDAKDRSEVTLAGTLKTVTLRPRSGTLALEAELYDGSDTLVLIWLGRRRILGLEPGRALKVTGRISSAGGSRVMFNPRYELRA
ncbi:MAG TPA: OB-fold nucleic acid binding domain-containing protein [Nocardioidaceae bacterium]|nr:OB-fold nucleic acid binding domain-containing protein [Nocardioidaceae bacterium]